MLMSSFELLACLLAGRWSVNMDSIDELIVVGLHPYYAVSQSRTVRPGSRILTAKGGPTLSADDCVRMFVLMQMFNKKCIISSNFRISLFMERFSLKSKV